MKKRGLEWKLRRTTLGQLSLLREIIRAKRLPVGGSKAIGGTVSGLSKNGFIKAVGVVGKSGKNYRQTIWEVEPEIYEYIDLINKILKP